MISAPAPERTSRPLDWLLVLSLAAVPLLHPLFSITGWSEALGRPQTPLAITALVTVVWVVVVGLSRTSRPVLTVVVSALLFSVVAGLLDLLVPALRSGEVRNLLDLPGLLAGLLVSGALHAAWGAVAGLLALALQTARGIRGR